MNRPRILQIALIWLTACATAVQAVEYQFTQNSEPVGFVDSISTVAWGTMVTTVAAPQYTNGYRFAFWRQDGKEQRDLTGHGVNPAQLQILQLSTATAVYRQVAQDDNTNSVPDWWELSFQTNLSLSGSSDLDADELSLSEEYLRDYHPNLRDDIQDGGLSMGSRRGVRIITDTNLVGYVINSSPPGFVEHATGVTNLGTTLSLPDAYGVTNGYRFVYWTLNGVIQTDSVGRAVADLEHLLDGGIEARAVFHPVSEDQDQDRVPDWWELHFTGDTAVAPESDDDGDGFGLQEEYRRDSHPGMRDTLAAGGITVSTRKSIPVITDTNLVQYSVSSTPSSFITPVTCVTNRGVTLQLDDRFGESNGYRFAYWAFNGDALTDSVGRAVSDPSVTLTQNSHVEAMFLLTDADVDSDSIPDWWESNFNGNLAANAQENGDGDDFDLSEEYRRDYHPGLQDWIAEGGLSVAAHKTFVLVDTNLVSYAFGSNPGGLVTSGGGITNRGAVVALPDAYGETNGYRFAYWSVDGVIQTDLVGRAQSDLLLTLSQSVTAEAHFMARTQDLDDDHVPDWWEFHFRGDTSDSAASDRDGDGLTFVEEYLRDSHPNMEDRLAEGGISMETRKGIRVNLMFFPRVAQSLLSGAARELFLTPSNTNVYLFAASNACPALGDWDGDLDLDVFVGGANGQLRVFENAGSPQVLNLVERTTNFAGIASAWTNLAQVAPALGDWDGDGFADLAIGGSTNVITLITSPGSWEGDALTGALRTNLVCSALVRASPAFGDISGDGWTDLLVLTDAGLVQAYTNTHLPLTPYLTPAFSSNLLGMAVQDATGITTADVNDDGVLDVLISDDNGNIWEFHSE